MMKSKIQSLGRVNEGVVGLILRLRWSYDMFVVIPWVNESVLLLSVFPLFMTNMLSFLWTRLPTISFVYVNHITSNA
jgi:hypothetical protein